MRQVSSILLYPLFFSTFSCNGFYMLRSELIIQKAYMNLEFERIVTNLTITVYLSMLSKQCLVCSFPILANAFFQKTFIDKTQEKNKMELFKCTSRPSRYLTYLTLWKV